METAGIITGDIVSSSKLPAKDREKLFAAIKKFLRSLRDEGWLSAFEMFRGDSIQCAAAKKEEVLRAALLIRCWLKANPATALAEQRKRAGAAASSLKGYASGKLDIRLSIGVGSVEFFKHNSLAHSDGEAFRLSGQGLDQIKNASHKMIVQTADPSLNEMLEPAILLLDAVLEKWTINQAETILYKLRRYKEDQIAGELGISQPAVNQRTKTSQWNAIEKLLDWFEKTINVPQT